MLDDTPSALPASSSGPGPVPGAGDPPGPDLWRAGVWSGGALLPAHERAPWAARRIVATALVAWGYDEVVELAELVVSELVSNAVRHAGDCGDLEVTVSADDDVVRLTVADGSPRRPQLRQDPVLGEGGLGLRLVERVALHWGVDAEAGGKRVWVELDASRSELHEPIVPR